MKGSLPYDHRSSAFVGLVPEADEHSWGGKDIVPAIQT
jgi:hypothetical protein